MIVAGVTAVIVLCIIGLVHTADAPPDGATDTTFAQLPLGSSESQVHDLLGTPSRDPALATFLPAPPAGYQCEYYREVDAWIDAGVCRFCFRADRLVEKGYSDGTCSFGTASVAAFPDYPYDKGNCGGDIPVGPQ